MKAKRAAIMKKAKAPNAPKPKRGRPRLTEAEKAADPVRAIKAEIKANLKKIKKTGKRLDLLLGKVEAERKVLFGSLLESLDKVKTDLKGVRRKAAKAKRGRPRKKAGRKPA